MTGITLSADCGECFALCCVGPTFSASADFAISKDAGLPCRHLRSDFRCGIHDGLRRQGFAGCTVFDCFGAGQKVCHVTFGGQDWRSAPHLASQMFDVFSVMRQLHELLWYLAEARTLSPARPIHQDLGRAFDAIDHLTQARPETLLKLDVAARRQEVNALLLQVSELVRAEARRQEGNGAGADHRGADLLGANLAGADLRGASLRGACLIGADLTGADLRVADLTGADVRGADLSGADLTGSIFLTQSQLNAAKGDARTALPPSLTRPSHWSSSSRAART